MEPLEYYTFKVEIPDDFDSTIKTEPFQDGPIKECPIETEPLQDDPIEEYPIRTEKNQDCTIKTEIMDDDILPESPQEEDPLMPTLWRQILNSQSKLMILNVHSYFRKLRITRAKQTGEEMNVHLEVARATGVSESTVKKLVAKCRNKGLEKAIAEPSKTRNRKRKTDIVVDTGEDSQTITVKKKQKIII